MDKTNTKIYTENNMKKHTSASNEVIEARKLIPSQAQCYGSGTTVLNNEQFEKVLSDLENPPEGTEGLKSILQIIDRGYSP